MPEPTDDHVTAWLRTARADSLLLGPGLGDGRDPAAVVTWFGAMQGQDLPGVLWSVGRRTAATRRAVSAALDSGALVRTWPMRGTLHLVPGADADWMVAHLARRSLDQAARRRATLGFDESVAESAAVVLHDALANGPLTRTQCLAVLAEAGIRTDGQRGYHLLWYSAARGVICLGPMRGREQAFARLDTWTTPVPRPDRATALRWIAERFVRSHGPVTAHDLARWADLTLADARSALATAPGVVEVTVGHRRYHLTDELFDRIGPPPGTAPRTGRRWPRAHALPGFDELVLGYRDRAAQLDPAAERLVVPGGNGMFAATLVVGGQVVGTWRRKELTRGVTLTARPFGPLDARARAALDRALVDYAEHVELTATVVWDP